MAELIVKFYAHPCAKSLKVLKHHIHKDPLVIDFVLPRNSRITEAYEHQAALSTTAMRAVKV